MAEISSMAPTFNAFMFLAVRQAKRREPWPVMSFRPGRNCFYNGHHNVLN